MWEKDAGFTIRMGRSLDQKDATIIYNKDFNDLAIQSPRRRRICSWLCGRIKDTDKQTREETKKRKTTIIPNWERFRQQQKTCVETVRMDGEMNEQARAIAKRI
jgi:hypothetical protein